MVLEIKKYPDSVLRKKCEEVKEITPKIKELVFIMVETMKEKEGIGISGPQVGFSKRIIAVQAENGPEVFINPKILKKSKEKEIMEEGCLSFPKFFLKIKRAKEIEIEAINLNGEKIIIKAQGLTARIFQHEIDHLDGILFIDRINLFKKIWLSLKI